MCIRDRCAAPGECNSGFCVDGVCCAGACDGTCEACDGSGTCSPEAPGTDPDGDCSEGVCDGAGVCATGAHRWSKRFGAAGADELTGLSSGPSGIALIGTYQQAPDFGDGPLPAPSNARGGFAVKLDGNGDSLWGRGVVDANSIGSLDGALAGNGGIVVGGEGTDVWDFGGPPIDHGLLGAGVLGAFSSSGGHAYTQDMQGYLSAVWRVEPSSDGGVVVVGTTLGDMAVLGGQSIVNTFFVMKLDSSGTSSWVAETSDGAPEAVDIAETATGDVLVVGSTGGMTAFDGVAVSGGPDASFLIRLSPSGAVTNIATFGGPNANVTSVAAAGDDAVIGGGFSSTVDFGGPTLTAQSGEDLFVARLDGSGSHVWSKRYGGSGDQRATGLASRDGAVVIAGENGGSLDFGVGSVVEGGGFLVKFHESGEPVWTRDLGGPVVEPRVELAADGSVVLGASFSGNVDLGGGVLSAAGTSDVCVGAYDP